MPEAPATATENPGKVLIPIARATISKALGRPYGKTSEDFPWLQEKGASFVTLTQNIRLRGCIGTLEAHRPLLIDVKANAQSAAFRDPRFPPLTEAELNITQIEISLLSAMQALAFSSEEDALAQLQPGVDGIVFEFGSYRSTFLPQVWEQLPDANIFMGHLKNKAGLHPDFWDEEVKLYRYSVSKWKEKDHKRS
ncbi:MAG: AmmeMemoRadiSam system protein A [Methylotenera sp.]|nr:AmmeMemoRadiSam system protein A [Methylotenera sp.]